MATSTISSTDTTDILNTLLAKFTSLEERVTALSERISTERSPTISRTPAPAMEPVEIPRPPATTQSCRSTATCKPPREPSLTGDKQHEWQEFEREFLRYFRITQGYYLEPEVQVDLLLATAGEKVRKVYYQLALSSEDAKNLEKVVIAIRQAFSQQQSTVVNKYLFMKIRREPGEELDSFVTRLREAARRCSFADEDQRVLEQLIFSTIDNVEVLKRMVKDSPPTLDEVIRILKADEVATLEMDRMVGKGVCVHTVSHDNRRPRNQENHQPRIPMKKGGKCDNCIFDHSNTDQCPAKNMECFYCQKRGHMIGKCRKRLAANNGGNQNPTVNKRGSREPKSRSVHEVEQLTESDDSDNESVAVDNIFVGSLGNDKNSWQTAIRIGNKLVNCKIDTGAEVNVMPQRIYNQLREKPKLRATKTILRTVAGQFSPLGVIEAPIQFKKRRSVAKFFVVDDTTQTLCGLQTSVELGLVQKLFQ